VTPLIVGAILALGAVAYVLWPLVARRTRDTAAAVDMREREGGDDDPAEAAIRRARAQHRVCPECGPRPEPAARYCSRCGRALA
jgi:hypothetical protein